jgi:predicted phage baseplate assembly protein
VSVALGNLVLADHGRTRQAELFAVVPEPRRVAAARAAPCEPFATRALPARFRPRLEEGPLTFAPPVDRSSARRAVFTDPGDALPAVTLTSSDGLDWTPSRDLLSAGPDFAGFVAEPEADGTSRFRFGDGHFGLEPGPGLVFAAVWRVGNGTRGNVGAGTLAHLHTPDGSVPDRILRVWNPLPARGGADPEPLEQVRQRAPVAYRTQARAVTPDDYARFAEGFPGVQRAAASFRWTGSWRTVFVVVDRAGGLPVDDDFERGLRGHLTPYRMAGHDLEVEGPRFVPLELRLSVCVGRDHFAADVRAALLRAFGRGTLPGGRTAFFHPDNFTFGQPVFLSRVYAAAQAVPGVERVEVTAFGRQGTPGSDASASGRLEVGRLEIARLDNDPNHPERGVLVVTALGGK